MISLWFSSSIFPKSLNSKSKSRFIRASSSDVPDFLSVGWLESLRKRPFGPRLSKNVSNTNLMLYNDQPRPDYRIEVMYRFAGFDPFERSIFFGPSFDLGQFERFIRIYHHSTYRVFLHHKERKILSTLNVEENRYKLRVWVGLMKKRHFSLPWFRELVAFGMVIGLRNLFFMMEIAFQVVWHIEQTAVR